MNDQDILSYGMRDKLGLGITIQQKPVILGVVPLYEEYTVLAERGYTITEWRDIAPMDRAFEVALWRIQRAIEFHRDDKQERIAKRKHK